MELIFQGYSDAYVIPGSGDDYLINDDKAANRRGLDLLEIERDKPSFSAALETCDLFINFDNDLFFTEVNDDLKPLLAASESIAVCSHALPAFSSSTIVLPTASYSEYDGVVVNGDGVLQRFSKAVYKNEDPADIVEITRLLGGAITDWTRSWPGIRQSVPLLSDVRPEQIPAEGLTLVESEDSNGAS